jgi:hypothetical protein
MICAYQDRKGGMPALEEVPILRIVRVADLVLHEETDPQRVSRLMERVREDGVLKNPPVVTPLEGTERYVVLDGANRTESLRSLGVRDAIVQIVDYGDVSVDTWNHLVADIDKGDLFEAIQAIAGIEVRLSDLPTARRLWQARSILAYIVSRDSDVHVIESAGSPRCNARLLNEMSNVYRGNASIYRVQTDNTGELLPYYDDVAVTIIYPPFEPQDILHLASNSAKLPTGITRHIIPRRALRVNVDLGRLAGDEPLEDKNTWLQAWLRQKLQAKEVRYYAEPTYLFDE